MIPGAGGSAWYWSRVTPALEAAGHAAIAVDLPGDDETAGLPEYCDLVTAAAQPRTDTDDLVLVAQSMGGFTAPLVCNRIPVSRLVLTNPMIPVPGETAGEWWDATGAVTARQEAARVADYPMDFDLQEYFLHDVAPEMAAEGEPYQRGEADRAFASVCDFATWPDIPIAVISGGDDRFFPVAFQQRLARERLGVEPYVIAGGHLMALSNPQGLADLLLRLAADDAGPAALRSH